MGKSITLRAALGISITIHLIAFQAGNFLCKRPIKHKSGEIEITYLLTETVKERMPEKIIENLPQKYDLKKKKTEVKYRSKKDKPDEIIKRSLEEAPIKEEAHLQEEGLKQLEEYIQYYELIRERIKKCVAAKYRNSRSQGSVDVTFVVGRTGSLKKLYLDQKKSTKDPSLVKAALESIKEASPFPVFPETLDKQELVFSIAIVFRKE